MADEGADAELLRDLERLREEYFRSLPAKLEELEARLHEARHTLEGGPLESARLLAHKLKGSAGTFGFDALTAEMRRIEGSLESAAPNLEPVWDEIKAALDRAREQLVDPGREAPPRTDSPGQTAAGWRRKSAQPKARR